MASLVVSALGIASIARSIRASNSQPAVRILRFALDVEIASCSGSTFLSSAVAAAYGKCAAHFTCKYSNAGVIRFGSA
jgi:hypothetical protein